MKYWLEGPCSGDVRRADTRIIHFDKQLFLGKDYLKVSLRLSKTGGTHKCVMNSCKFIYVLTQGIPIICSLNSCQIVNFFKNQAVLTVCDILASALSIKSENTNDIKQKDE